MYKKGLLIIGLLLIGLISGCASVDSAKESQEETTQSDKLSVAYQAPAIPPKAVSENASEANVSDGNVEGIIPLKLEIPAIGVSADVEPVGRLSNGEMGVPSTFEGIGWYEPTIKPGEVGNAVLDGHVDSKTGPAVFYNLKKLEKGDEVKVTDKNGKTLVFVVTDKTAYPRDNAPIEKIFGYTNQKSLNLITCTGLFDRGVGTHQQRLVVYTVLKEK